MKSKMLMLIAFLGFTIGLCNQSSAQNACDGSLWKYVYRPERLKVWSKCKTVTGTVMKKITEADGDYEIRLKLDAGQPRFLNQKNMDKQHGCLLLEIICQGKVTDTDATGPCKDCPGNVTVPNVGDHVKVTGTFVTDTDADNGWNEIHPVYSVEVVKE